MKSSVMKTSTVNSFLHYTEQLNKDLHHEEPILVHELVDKLIWI